MFSSVTSWMIFDVDFIVNIDAIAGFNVDFQAVDQLRFLLRGRDMFDFEKIFCSGSYELCHQAAEIPDQRLRRFAGFRRFGVILKGVFALQLLRRVHGGPRVRELGSTFARALLLALLAGVAAHEAAAWTLTRVPGVLPQLGVGLAAFAAVALPGVFVLGDAALRETVRRLLARLRRKGRG